MARRVTFFVPDRPVSGTIYVRPPKADDAPEGADSVGAADDADEAAAER